jgi:hypothetical protein
MAHAWGLWDQRIGLSQLIESTHLMCFAAKWVGKPRVMFHSTFHDGKQEMLDAAWKLLDEADALMSWNGKGFDTKHLMREFLEAGMPPPSPHKEIDLMLTAKRRFRFPSNKLQYVSTLLGLEGKQSHEGFGLWLKCLDGDAKAWGRMRRYNKQDVVLLEQLYEKLLPWIVGHPNVNLYGDGADLSACPKCGGTDLRKRGFAYTPTSRFQQYRCEGCGTWSRTGKRDTGADVREVTA